MNALRLMLSLFFCVALAWTALGEETHARRTQARKEQLDLPVTPPRLGAKMDGFYPHREDTPPPTPDDDGDDPRDTPPPTFYGEEIECESDSLIYVLDRSGSMAHGKPSKWGRAVKETVRSVLGLSNNFRYDVIVFGSYVRAQWGELHEATEQNKVATIEWISAQQPGGGTPTGPACVAALSEDRSNMTLVLLSDGAPSTGTKSTAKVIRDGNAQGAAINCFGVDAYGEFRAFLQQVASDSGGRYTDVP